MKEVIVPSDASAWAREHNNCLEPPTFYGKEVGEVVKVDYPIQAYAPSGGLFDIRKTVEISPIRYVISDRKSNGVVFDNPKRVGSCKLTIIHIQGQPSRRYAFISA